MVFNMKFNETYVIQSLVKHNQGLPRQKNFVPFKNTWNQIKNWDKLKGLFITVYYKNTFNYELNEIIIFLF